MFISSLVTKVDTIRLESDGRIRKILEDTFIVTLFTVKVSLPRNTMICN